MIESVERGKAIELALTQIEKQFGKGSIMRLGTKDALVPADVIPTGSLSFEDGVRLVAARGDAMRDAVAALVARLSA